MHDFNGTMQVDGKRYGLALRCEGWRLLVAPWHDGQPGIDPEVAVRLMLAGFLLGIVQDRRLMREAQVNLAIRWFIGYALHEALPDHSSLTRIRQRWGEDVFRGSSRVSCGSASWPDWFRRRPFISNQSVPGECQHGCADLAPSRCGRRYQRRRAGRRHGRPV